MTTNPLVSIITPCYNGEKFIGRFLNSVLAQTYPNIELFVYSYIKQFQMKGMQLHYIYQKHSGQAAAMNKALNLFHGDYLTWLDSDDYFKSNSIIQRVKFLENNLQYGFCICPAENVNERDIRKVVDIRYRKKPIGQDNLFIDLLTETNVVFESGGGMMIRKDSFCKVCPTRQIYPSREGQNWQLMLPVAYYYKCGYVEEPLYVVVNRGNSHSHIFRTPEQWFERYEGFKDLLFHVIKDMKIPEEKEILDMLEIKYAHREIRLAPELPDLALLKNAYQCLLSHKELGPKDNLAYFVGRHKGLRFPYEAAKQCWHKMKEKKNEIN